MSKNDPHQGTGSEESAPPGTRRAEEVLVELFAEMERRSKERPPPTLESTCHGLGNMVLAQCLFMRQLAVESARLERQIRRKRLPEAEIAQAKAIVGTVGVTLHHYLAPAVAELEALRAWKPGEDRPPPAAAWMVLAQTLGNDHPLTRTLRRRQAEDGKPTRPKPGD